MDQWHTLNLDDALLAAPVVEGVRERVTMLMEEGVNPAVFTRNESGSVHCAMQLYFSPAAADIARSLDATACPRPAATGLELIAGPEDAWTRLFPGSSQARQGKTTR